MTFPTPNLADDDHLHEECGVFGVYGSGDAATHTVLGLHALQHRGQEATGIVSWDGEQFHARRCLGQVAENFAADSSDALTDLKGFAAIGHNRYSTAGGSDLRDVQPLFAETALGGIGLCHNGNLTNALKLRAQLVNRGCLFQSGADTETLIHLIALAKATTLAERMVEAVRQVEGAYSLIALTHDVMIGIRDPLGVRPLVLGQLGTAYILASETCALDILGATFLRDVAPGEMVIISDEGLRSLRPFPDQAPRFCLFEYIYFSRPDSVVEGQSVYAARKAIGAQLAREQPAVGEVVVPVPDSGVAAAIGYAEAAGIPFDLGIIRNHYVGRTFIQPSEHVRHLGVKLKHNANRTSLDGKRVILVDDSIVRGTTSVKIVEMVRAAGAREVHMRIASPPTTHSCFYGVDTPERDQLLAAHMNVEEMGKTIGVDSLAFVSLDGLYQAMGKGGRDPDRPHYCDACLTGEYPIPLTDHKSALGTSPRTLLAAVS